MAIVVAGFLVLVALMYLGWRARARRQGGLPKPQAVPPESDLGRVFGSFEGLYAATTSGNDPLDRIVVRNLGFRGKAIVQVAEAGVVVRIPGSEFFIPVADTLETGVAGWTIDRGVEERGLDRVTWNLGEKPVDSYFRMAEPRAFAGAIEAMLSSERHNS